MTNSETPSLETTSNPPRWIAWSYLGIAFLGFLDAGYLTAHHYLGTPLLCSIVQGCETVTTSQYSAILGIPVALMGAFYYLAILLLVVWYFDRGRVGALRFVGRITVLGFLFSVWLVFAQLVLIREICLYCMVSALTSTLLFCITIASRRRL